MKKFLKLVTKRNLSLFTFYKSLPAAFRYFKSKKIPTKQKLLYVGIILGYLLLPTLDFIPVLGWLDDTTVIAFALHAMKNQYKLYHQN